MRKGFNFILCGRIFIYPSYLLERPKDWSFLFEVLAPCWNHMTKYLSIYFVITYQSVHFVCLFILMPVPHCSWLWWLCSMFEIKNTFIALFLRLFWIYWVLWTAIWTCPFLQKRQLELHKQQINLGSIANYITFLGLLYKGPQSDWPK